MSEPRRYCGHCHLSIEPGSEHEEFPCRHEPDPAQSEIEMWKSAADALQTQRDALRAERDKYKAALEKIARRDDQAGDIAWAALKGNS